MEIQFQGKKIIADDKNKNLKRLLIELPENEATEVIQKFELGQKTGYATVDRPWDSFYQNNERKNLFLNTTPYQGLLKANKNYLNEDAIEYFGTTISFDTLLKNIDIIAKSLQEYNIKKGDYVTICSTTTPEVIYLFYALSKLGAVANVMSPFYNPDELLSRINECESKIIIMVDKFMPKFKDILCADKSKNVIVLPMMNSSLLNLISKKYKLDRGTNEVTWKQFVVDGKHRKQTITDLYEPNKPQAMVYSSGTTGASKGILLSVDSFQKLINAYGNTGFDTSRKQKVYQNIPPWHSTGLSLGINFPLSYGVKVCTDPRFDHNVFVKNVLKFQPEYILTNTSMYQGFTTEENIRRLKRKSLSFLKYPVEGGEPLTIRDIENIAKVFMDHGTVAELLNGYGQCECGATITTDITGHKFSSNASGIPLPDIVTIGIFDDNYKELKYGQRGNILVNTEVGMIEYFKNKKATDEYFYIDCNGTKWSQTGDIGYINEDGSLVVLGRKNDFSVIDGVKMFNFDISRSILSSPKVKLCEVKAHPENDNVLVAHIVWSNEFNALIKENPNVQNDCLKEIQDIIMEQWNIPQAVPYCFCIRDSFPSAPSGKRDIKYVQNDIENMIELKREFPKRLVLK